MVIKICSSSGFRITIPIANGLICNPVSAKLIVSQLKKQRNIEIQPDHIEILFKEIKNIRKNYGKLTIVDVQSADGERVKIQI